VSYAPLSSAPLVCAVALLDNGGMTLCGGVVGLHCERKKATARFRLLTLSFSSVIELNLVSLYKRTKGNVKHEFAKWKARITVIIPCKSDVILTYCLHYEMQLLTQRTPDFIPPILWPPNSPDLNPVDYKVWAVMQKRVYKTKIVNVDELCDRIVNAWEELDQRVIDSAVIDSGVHIHSMRLCDVCVCSGSRGGHFEHIL